MSRPTCETCPFFASQIETRETTGQCRIKPPAAAMVTGPAGLQVHAFWPPAQPTQWCGEHPERKKAAAQTIDVLAGVAESSRS